MLSKLPSLKEKSIVLFITPRDDSSGSAFKIGKHYISSKYPIIYLSVNKPYSAVIDLMQKNKILTTNLLVIDGITPVGFGMKKIDNCIFLGSPRALTTISLVINSAFEKINQKNTLLFLDSLNTLCLYNHNEGVLRFMHSLANKIKDYGASGIILTLEKGTDEKVISQVSQFCDRVVEI